MRHLFVLAALLCVGLYCGETNAFALGVNSLRCAAPASKRPVGPLMCAATAQDAQLRTVVVTDMDETLISRKSTGYIIAFLVRYRAFLRLAVSLPLAAFLIPISKVSRSLAVRIMYWLAFRGIRVDKAQAIAATFLSERYVRDLQDPAASALLSADEAIVITASPTFMAAPWLGRFFKVPASNVRGAELESRNGRFTGRTAAIPIGETKADILRAFDLRGARTVGYGDHPTDVPFLRACDRGVLVHEIDEMPDGIEMERARRFEQMEKLAAQPEPAAS
uniref:LNS2/PITP domain-containing protein n=1 Tax=Chrysotila carterae TaxID=13221 RepID=A0A7S4BKE9_CHRCT|mmetsp:Transcript_5365/g.11684  ORF Transcript_5365/g.11684 Transcript_5365/m.11684 type:complete len:278 (+) Transcript_5365:194-1027(+)